jgi:hypothetical protein
MNRTFKVKNPTWKDCLAIFIAVVLLLILWVGLLGGIFTLLWNWVAVELFSAPVISWWQGVGLVLLLTIIGGFFKGQASSK